MILRFFSVLILNSNNMFVGPSTNINIDTNIILKLSKNIKHPTRKEELIKKLLKNIASEYENNIKLVGFYVFIFIMFAYSFFFFIMNLINFNNIEISLALNDDSFFCINRKFVKDLKENESEIKYVNINGIDYLGLLSSKKNVRETILINGIVNILCCSLMTKRIFSMFYENNSLYIKNNSLYVKDIVYKKFFRVYIGFFIYKTDDIKIINILLNKNKFFPNFLLFCFCFFLMSIVNSIFFYKQNLLNTLYCYKHFFPPFIAVDIRLFKNKQFVLGFLKEFYIFSFLYNFLIPSLSIFFNEAIVYFKTKQLKKQLQNLQIQDCSDTFKVSNVDVDNKFINIDLVKNV